MDLFLILFRTYYPRIGVLFSYVGYQLLFLAYLSCPSNFLASQPVTIFFVYLLCDGIFACVLYYRLICAGSGRFTGSGQADEIRNTRDRRAAAHLAGGRCRLRHSPSPIRALVTPNCTSVSMWGS